MQTTDIEREIRSFLVDNFLFGRADKLRDDDLLLGKVIDSTGVLELVTFLQDHFGISIPDADVTPENLESVNKLVSYISKKLQNPA